MCGIPPPYWRAEILPVETRPRLISTVPRCAMYQREDETHGSNHLRSPRLLYKNWERRQGYWQMTLFGNWSPRTRIFLLARTATTMLFKFQDSLLLRNSVYCKMPAWAPMRQCVRQPQKQRRLCENLKNLGRCVKVCVLI